MKATELIAALQSLLAQHGDLPVKFDDHFGDNPPAEVSHVGLGGEPSAQFIHLYDDR